MMANLNNVHPTKQPYIETDLFTPFTTTEEAWFWFMKALAAQQDGAKPRKGLGLQSRPCEPSDIQKIVERLHQRRVLLLEPYPRTGALRPPRHTAQSAPLL